MTHKTALIAIATLLVAAAVAYVAFDRLGGSPNSPALKAAAEKALAEPKGDAKAAVAGKGEAKGGPGGGGPVPVAVVKLVPTAVQEDLPAVGSLRSNESVMLRPEVSGRIATIGFRDGQAVRRGDVLIGLDASLQEAEVVKARAELDLAQSNFKRTEDLARKNFVSGSAQEQAASSAQVAAANLKLAEARLAKMRLVAPFDGVAGIRSVSVGDYVKEGADLVNLEDIGTLKVDYRLPERAFEQVRVGLPVEVVADALPDRRFAGAIEAINPRIDAGGRSLEVRARLANRGGNLRPGMFVRVRTIVGSRPNALLVPEEAIVPAGGEFYVFRVIERDGQKVAQRVKVRPGVRRDGTVELTDGVAAGDLIVTAGSRLGRDGQPVRVVEPAGKG
ncbi:MAG: efflux RND transporter periplasmic adaptor subunit [Betaproteobacteria bacterium]